MSSKVLSVSESRIALAAEDWHQPIREMATKTEKPVSWQRYEDESVKEIHEMILKRRARPKLVAANGCIDFPTACPSVLNTVAIEWF